MARVDGRGGRRRPAGAGPVAQALLEEILVDPARGRRRASDRIAVAHTGDEAMALVPLPPAPVDGRRATGDAGRPSGCTPTRCSAPCADPLARGPGRRRPAHRSASAPPCTRPRGCAARWRRPGTPAGWPPPARAGSARPGHEELASHVLLLPFVPDDVRRAFTARLLDPLRDYDRRHRAELIPTLEAFLDCDGSWTRCATRLHLHVNTLRYRVGRIEQLTGRDLSRLEDKLDFFLALRMS